MTVRWNTSVYTQERSIMHISNIDTRAAYIRVQVSSGELDGTVAKYSIPASKNLDIDFSDLVRLSDTGECAISEYSSADTNIGIGYTMRWTQVGRINPTTYFRALPPDSMMDAFQLSVAAPSVMYKRLGVSADPIMFELAGYSGYDFVTGRINFPPLADDPIEFASTIEIPNDADSVEFWHLADRMYNRYSLKELECGKRYAEVEWVSFTGKTRRHVFEVVKLTEETTKEVSLEMLTNEYDVRKGRRVSFSLRIEGLTAYDYWYYSDLVTSSSVRVSLSGTAYCQVQVTAERSVIPETSEGKPLTLEIPINYVRYDAI